MLEVNAITFLLLLEGFVLLTVTLLVLVIFTILRRRRRNRAVLALATRIKQGTGERNEKTGSFLDSVFHFDGEHREKVMTEIHDKELAFFRLLIDTLQQGQPRQLDTLDTALQEVIDAYKCLQPIEVEATDKPHQREITEARQQNQQLREDLSLVRNQMSNLIDEFSDMFGGGQGNRMTIDEVMEHLSEGRVETGPAMADDNPAIEQVADNGEPRDAVQEEGSSETGVDENLELAETASDDGTPIVQDKPEKAQLASIQSEATDAGSGSATDDDSDSAINDNSDSATEVIAGSDEGTDDAGVEKLPRVAQK